MSGNPLFHADIIVGVDPKCGRVFIRGHQEVPIPAAWTYWEDSPDFIREVSDWNVWIQVSLLQIAHDLDDNCACRVHSRWREIRTKEKARFIG